MIGLLLGANCIAAIVLVFRWGYIPPQLPLFYSLPAGEDQLVEWWMIFILPLLMNGLVILNMTIASQVSIQNEFAHSLLRNANYAVMFLCIYIFLRIVFTVT